jgi:hypothetical protein
MSEFLALHHESKYDFLLHLCIFVSVTRYKRNPFGRFLNSKKYKILRTYRNKHLNIESKRNKNFTKLIIHKEVLKLSLYRRESLLPSSRMLCTAQLQFHRLDLNKFNSAWNYRL